MNLAHLLEAGMLVCFGVSWPLNVIKAYKARTAKGTSLAFIILIITGYVAGISAKIINHQFNYVLAVYFLNLIIVTTNVLVYIRNKTLDRKASEKKELKVDIKKILEDKENEMLNYSNSLDEVINKETSAEKLNAVLLIGGTMDKAIPVSQLASQFEFNFDIYNKSESKLTLDSAYEYYRSSIAPLCPEGIIFHLGEEDISLFQNDSSTFDSKYMQLLDAVKKDNNKCRIALVSVNNPDGNKNISLMNAHIKAISEIEQVTYINLNNAKLWNPEAAKSSSDFAYSMGLRIRRPLRDVAEILYSYAYRELEVNKTEILAG